MKHVYLVRHGQTLFNRQKKIQGVCDSPLSKVGIAQAQIARNHLDELGIHFDQAFSSTSERACDTLELLTDIPYSRHKDLREWNFGDLEGEGEHLNPPLPYRDFFVQFGGEDETDFNTRITSAIKSVVDSAEGSTILIVSHGAAIAQFYRSWEHASDIKRTGRILNCSFLHYQYEDECFELQEIINHDFSLIE